MKTLIMSLTLLSSLVWAGGNGTGTMSPEKGMSKASNNNSAILYYQGETKNNIYFKFGQSQGSKWDIEQFKVNKKTDLLNEAILDALEKSKSTNNWSKINFPILNEVESN